MVAGAVCTVTITIRNPSGVVQAGITPTITTTGTGVVTTQPGATNALGVASGSLTVATSQTIVITVRADGQELEAHPSVVVTTSTPTVLLQEDFLDGNLTTRGWYDGNAPTMSTQDAVPCIQAAFTAGGATPSWVIKRHAITPTDRLYVRFRVKYSTNWIGSGQSFHPHEWMFLSDVDTAFSSLALNVLNTYIEQNYQSGGIPKLLVQDSQSINYSQGPLPNNLVGVTENRSVCGCNGVLEPTSGTPDCFDNGGGVFYSAKDFDAPSVAFTNTPGAGYKNNWNTVEVYCQMNSVVGGIGQADGIMQYSFNGAMLLNRSNILFRTGQRPNLRWGQVVLAPFMNSSPIAQTVWYSNLLVMTGPPATGPATQVTFTVQPSAVLVGAVITPPIQVSVEDIGGSVVPTATNLVSLGVNSGPGLLGGNASKAAVAGVATFDDITVSQVGSYTLVASSAGLTSDVSSSFAVSAGGGGGAWPNEPSGYTVVSDYAFSDVIPTQAHVQIPGSGVWWTNGGNASRIVDATAPVSPSFVVEYSYPQGFAGGTAPANLYILDVGATNGLYIAFYWKPSNPWDFHGSNINKLIFQLLGVPGGGQVYLHMQNDATLRATLQLTSMPTQNLSNNVNNNPATLGQWHLVEWHMRKSPSLFRWWLDGVLQGDYTSVVWPGNAFDELHLDPTWGGGGENKETNDYFRYDHIRISRGS